MTKEKVIKSYKGFDKNMQCRGFQYEVGKEYEMDGNISSAASEVFTLANHLWKCGIIMICSTRVLPRLSNLGKLTGKMMANQQRSAPHVSRLRQN